MWVDEDIAASTAGLEELFARVAGRFVRTEPRRRRARAYVRGLLAPIADKNGWTLAEVAGDSNAGWDAMSAQCCGVGRRWCSG